jgi:AAA domain
MAPVIDLPKPHRAEKKRVKLKLGVAGPSGSGKTLGALALIKNLWPGAKVLCVDTENQSAELYSDHPLAPEFDELPLAPPFTSERYEACIDLAVKQGYDVCLIDGITHQWEGDGGILRRKDKLDQRPGNQNSYMNWNTFTPEHTHFLEVIKQAPIHILATMRSRQDYEIVNENGKAKPVKLGMAPIVREGTEYEFTIVFDVQMDHLCTLSKNRTGLFEGKVIDLADPQVAADLRAWLESGKAVEAAKDWSSASVRQSNQPATQTAPARKEFPAPIITEYPVTIDKGRGSKRKPVQVMWYELVGYVIGIKHEKVKNEGNHTFLGIHGLPETDKVLGERHRRFESFENHLQLVPTAQYPQPIMAKVKPGSKIVFRYFPEVLGPKARVPGTLAQYIEEVVQIDDNYYDEEGNSITMEQAAQAACEKAASGADSAATAEEPEFGGSGSEEATDAQGEAASVVDGSAAR